MTCIDLCGRSTSSSVLSVSISNLSTPASMMCAVLTDRRLVWYYCQFTVVSRASCSICRLIGVDLGVDPSKSIPVDLGIQSRVGSTLIGVIDPLSNLKREVTFVLRWCKSTWTNLKSINNSQCFSKVALQAVSRPIHRKFLHANHQLMATMWSLWTSLSRQPTVIWRPLSVKHCDAALYLHHCHYRGTVWYGIRLFV